jgi:hypothetical protein
LNFAEHFSCLTTNRCIQRRHLYQTKGHHCEDESDLVYPWECKHRTDFACNHRRGWKVPIEYFLFQEICNGQNHTDLIDDETNCDDWQSVCNLKYRQCDGIITCADRRDELNCNANSECKRTEKNLHCYRYPQHTTAKSTCLPISLIDNGVVDCYGSIDEDIGYCARHYPQNATTRFHCYNHSKCIRLEDICDGISDCPHNDDEMLCPKRLAAG